MTDNTKPKPMYLYPHEVFENIEKQSSFHDRVKHLKDNATFAIKTILQVNFSDTIVFDLPDGAVPYERDTTPVGNSLGRIDKAIKVLPRLIKDPADQSLLARSRKEMRFIQLLEGMNQKDADVVIAMKDKKLTAMYPLLDRTLANTAFPHLVAAEK
jgi:hypothetical protein